MSMDACCRWRSVLRCVQVWEQLEPCMWNGRAAREQGCNTATRLDVTAIAHHPYVRGGSRSPLTPPRRDEITISSISRLKTILAQGARRGLIPRGGATGPPKGGPSLAGPSDQPTHRG